jgi:hypothetical protein
VAVDTAIVRMTQNEFVRCEPLNRIDIIKVDIQRAEPLFLRGGAAVSTEFRRDLLLEVSASDLAGMGLTSRDLLQRVESLGYD